uniref:Chemokine-like receptor 1 like 2 n=1 Tax=Erpetoichthys calabaricus TaxID=27687 RepID=A0A8C4SWI7_ERPCA
MSRESKKEIIYMSYENYSHYDEKGKVHDFPLDKVDQFGIIVAVLYTIIFLLGVSGNILVIWIAGFKMKKTVNTTWFLSLAAADFLFCLFIPFNAVYMASGHWHFGLALCKVISFVMFINMFSSIFTLTIISIDRFISVIFPVWAQNYRAPKTAFVVVVIIWCVSFLLSIPSLVFRQTISKREKISCFNNYGENKQKEKNMMIVLMIRFICGFVIPFLLITFCYVVIIFKLKKNHIAKSSKPFKIMGAIICSFFVCWVPYHIFTIIEIDHPKYNMNILNIGIQCSVLLASSNSFLNPLLYVFMGKDFKHKLRLSVISKMENAMSEDTHTMSRKFSKATLSSYDKASTAI